MFCKFHTDRPAERYCAGCGVPLCRYCSQGVILGEYYCFQCAMLISRYGNAPSRGDEDLAFAGNDFEVMKGKGPLHYFCIVAFVMIIIMIGVMV